MSDHIEALDEQLSRFGVGSAFFKAACKDPKLVGLSPEDLAGKPPGARS